MDPPWGLGNHPFPFCLARDCVEAVCGACLAAVWKMLAGFTFVISTCYTLKSLSSKKADVR